MPLVVLKLMHYIEFSLHQNHVMEHLLQLFLSVFLIIFAGFLFKFTFIMLLGPDSCVEGFHGVDWLV